ncbi:uncharacterized protein METZ01_LOCUS479515, partial [marine metagenome]
QKRVSSNVIACGRCDQKNIIVRI